MNIPHLDQWLGLWLMDESNFVGLHELLSSIDLHVHLQTGPTWAAAEAQRQSQPIREAAVEFVFLSGPLMKTVPSAGDGTSTVLAKRKLRAAAANPDIGGVLLHIDSPGGTASGIQDLADEIAATARRKPVYAFVPDFAASAAVWAASQATKIFANPMARYGSIGAYGVVVDESGKAEKDGRKVHVVRSAEMKGLGVPGTKITEAQLAEIQQQINSTHDFFVDAVATGRRLSPSRVKELADGRTHVAAKALELKLIDGVQSLDATFSQLLSAIRKGTRMDATTTAAVVSTAVEQHVQADASAAGAAGGNTAAGAAPQAAAPAPAAAAPAAAAPATAQSATLAQLKAACSGASNDFLVSQLETGATLDQARAAWMAKLSADNARLATENAQLRTAGPASGSAAGNNAAPGANPVPAGAAGGKSTGASVTGDASIDAFEAAVAEEMDRTKKPRHEAVKAVCAKDPEMREAMVAAHNAKYAARARRARD